MKKTKNPSPRSYLTGPLAYQRLYRERVSVRHDAVVVVVLVVQHVRVGMKCSPDAVTTWGKVV